MLEQSMYELDFPCAKFYLKWTVLAQVCGLNVTFKRQRSTLPTSWKQLYKWRRAIYEAALIKWWHKWWCSSISMTSNRIDQELVCLKGYVVVALGKGFLDLSSKWLRISIVSSAPLQNDSLDPTRRSSHVFNSLGVERWDWSYWSPKGRWSFQHVQLREFT